MDEAQAIIAMPGASHAARSVADLCQAAGLRDDGAAYSDIVSGKVSVSQLRESSWTTCSDVIRCSSMKAN